MAEKNLEEMREAVAVSYTHLDVYKRQPQHRPPSPTGDAALCAG